MAATILGKRQRGGIESEGSTLLLPCSFHCVLTAAGLPVRTASKRRSRTPQIAQTEEPRRTRSTKKKSTSVQEDAGAKGKGLRRSETVPTKLASQDPVASPTKTKTRLEPINGMFAEWVMDVG